MTWVLCFSRATPALPASMRRMPWWRRLVGELFERYRPERHYMRGPGPKWHAKHGQDFAPQEAARQAVGSRPR